MLTLAAEIALAKHVRKQKGLGRDEGDQGQGEIRDKFYLRSQTETELNAKAAKEKATRAKEEAEVQG